MSYTYGMYVTPVNRPVLSSVPFISSVYILVTVKVLLSSRLAGYFSSILLMLLWPVRQWPLTSFIGTRIRFVRMSIIA
jgi:ABC-type multidrug transport system permease subunit